MMKEKMKKKYIYIIIPIILIGIIIILSIDTYYIKITNYYYIPPSTYTLEMNSFGKGVLIEYNSCSDVDCEGEEEKLKFNLTYDEHKKVDIILKKLQLKRKGLYKIYYKQPDDLNASGDSFLDYDTMQILESTILAIESIAKGNEEFSTKEDIYYDESEDLNNDGIVTSREFGNKYLNDIINELQ